MNFKANVKDLMNALDPVREISTKVTIKEFPHGERITIQAKKNSITALAFGGTASIVADISDSNFSSLGYECVEEGKVTIKAKNLFEYLESFPPEQIEICTNGNKLQMSLVSNKKTKRGMPVFDEEVTTIPVSNDFSQDIQVNREVMLKGLNKVAFAMCDEKTAPHYHCISLTSKKDSVMFASGAGARFAINIYEGGDKVFKSKTGDADVKIPQSHVSTLKNILQKSCCDYINVKYSSGNDDGRIPEQLVFAFGAYVICMKDISQFSGFPKLDDMIGFHYSNRVVGDLKDFQYPIKAIKASYDGYDASVHNSEFRVNPDDGKIIISTKTNIPSTDEINMDVDKSVVSGDNIWFCANSVWFNDFATSFSKEGPVEINFNSMSEIENLREDSEEDVKIIKKFKKKPVLVKYPEIKDGASDILEKFYIFFVISTKY